MNYYTYKQQDEQNRDILKLLVSEKSYSELRADYKNLEEITESEYFSLLENMNENKQKKATSRRRRA